MMIARSGLLRANLNRKVKLEGTFEVTQDNVLVYGMSTKVVKPAAPSSKERPETASELFYRAGTILQLSWDLNVEIDGRVLLVKYPDSLYASGIVSAPTYLDSDSPTTPLVVMYHVVKDVDLAELEPVKLYVEGD